MKKELGPYDYDYVYYERDAQGKESVCYERIPPELYSKHYGDGMGLSLAKSLVYKVARYPKIEVQIDGLPNVVVHSFYEIKDDQIRQHYNVPGRHLGFDPVSDWVQLEFVPFEFR